MLGIQSTLLVGLNLMMYLFHCSEAGMPLGTSHMDRTSSTPSGGKERK